jgi:hypothetical protein
MGVREAYRRMLQLTHEGGKSAVETVKTVGTEPLIGAAVGGAMLAASGTHGLALARARAQDWAMTMASGVPGVLRSKSLPIVGGLVISDRINSDDSLGKKSTLSLINHQIGSLVTHAQGQARTTKVLKSMKPRGLKTVAHMSSGKAAGRGKKAKKRVNRVKIGKPGPKAQQIMKNKTVKGIVKGKDPGKLGRGLISRADDELVRKKKLPPRHLTSWRRQMEKPLLLGSDKHGIRGKLKQLGKKTPRSKGIKPVNIKGVKLIKGLASAGTGLAAGVAAPLIIGAALDTGTTKLLGAGGEILGEGVGGDIGGHITDYSEEIGDAGTSLAAPVIAGGAVMDLRERQIDQGIRDEGTGIIGKSKEDAKFVQEQISEELGGGIVGTTAGVAAGTVVGGVALGGRAITGAGKGISRRGKKLSRWLGF